MEVSAGSLMRIGWSLDRQYPISCESHRAPQRACETKFVAVGVNQVEETLSPFGVAGRSSWLAPRRQRTFVKSINIGDVKDHAPPPGPAPLSRLGDEVEIAHPRSKTSE